MLYVPVAGRNHAKPIQIMPPDETPSGVAIVVCDRVITEAVTNNKTLVSIFNTINAPAFPCRHERLTVYVALTNGQGQKQVKLSLKDSHTSELVGVVAGSVPFMGPNQVVELIFSIQNVIFARPGTYAFEVSADEVYVFESRFTVNQVPPIQ